MVQCLANDKMHLTLIQSRSCVHICACANNISSKLVCVSTRDHLNGSNSFSFSLSLALYFSCCYTRQSDDDKRELCTYIFQCELACAFDRVHISFSFFELLIKEVRRIKSVAQPEYMTSLTVICCFFLRSLCLSATLTLSYFHTN